jgi:hypothetical protein
LRAISLECVPEYPASVDQYELVDPKFQGISDHTPNLDLYLRALEKPNLKWFEMHVCLDDNCYERAWSKTFDEIEEVIG